MAEKQQSDHISGDDGVANEKLEQALQIIDFTEELSSSNQTPARPGDDSDTPFKLEDFDTEAIAQGLDFEQLDLSGWLPPQSPVTVEVPFLGVRLSKTAEGVKLESASTPPPLELPPADVTPEFTDNQCIEASGKAVDDTAPDAGGELFCILDGLSTDLEKGLLVPRDLVGKSVQEVRDLFGASENPLIASIVQYWNRQAKSQLCIKTVSELLRDRGIKLKRRKRMGSEVPAPEKKAIRAQRNRERSQALRRHHKKRMQSLEQAGEQLLTENSSMRSLINCLLEEVGALTLLQAYFDNNGCSEALISFLRHVT